MWHNIYPKIYRLKPSSKFANLGYAFLARKKKDPSRIVLPRKKYLAQLMSVTKIPRQTSRSQKKWDKNFIGHKNFRTFFNYTYETPLRHKICDFGHKISVIKVYAVTKFRSQNFMPSQSCGHKNFTPSQSCSHNKNRTFQRLKFFLRYL